MSQVKKHINAAARVNAHYKSVKDAGGLVLHTSLSKTAKLDLDLIQQRKGFINRRHAVEYALACAAEPLTTNYFD